MIVEELGEEIQLAGLSPVRNQGGAVGVGWWEIVSGGGGGWTGGCEAVLADEVETVGLFAHCGVVEVWQM